MCLLFLCVASHVYVATLLCMHAMMTDYEWRWMTDYEWRWMNDEWVAQNYSYVVSTTL